MKKLISISLSLFIFFSTICCFNFSAYAENETATDISFSSPISSSFDRNHTWKDYMITLPESGTITFNCSGNLPYNVYISKPGNFFSYASMYHNYVNYDAQKKQACSNFSIRLVAGTYCITAKNELSASGQYANYNFTCYFTPSNESFFESQAIDNNSFKHAYEISLNTLYSGQFALNDSYDYYYFDTTKCTATVYISSNEDITYELYNSSQSSIDYYKLFINDKCEHSQSYKLEKGKYYLKVYTTNTSGGEYSFSISTKKDNISKPEKISIKSLSTNKKKHSITLKWNKAKNANGYQIYYSKNKKFNNNIKKININGANINSYTLNKLKKGKRYYIKIRAYKYVGNKKLYGNWSNIKSIKCK